MVNGKFLFGGGILKMKVLFRNGPTSKKKLKFWTKICIDCLKFKLIENDSKLFKLRSNSLRAVRLVCVKK